MYYVGANLIVEIRGQPQSVQIYFADGWYKINIFYDLWYNQWICALRT